MKSDQRHATNINKEVHFKYKIQSQCFQYVFVPIYFFNQNSWCSPQSTTKSTKCEKLSLPLTKE